jgi:hypothetical protein
MTISLPVERNDIEGQRVAEIAALHARIVACRACETAGFVPAARPLRHPWTERQRTMIVGQAGQTVPLRGSGWRAAGPLDGEGRLPLRALARAVLHHLDDALLPGQGAARRQR